MFLQFVNDDQSINSRITLILHWNLHNVNTLLGGPGAPESCCGVVRVRVGGCRRQVRRRTWRSRLSEAGMRPGAVASVFGLARAGQGRSARRHPPKMPRPISSFRTTRLNCFYFPLDFVNFTIYFKISHIIYIIYLLPKTELYGDSRSSSNFIQLVPLKPILNEFLKI